MKLCFVICALVIAALMIVLPVSAVSEDSATQKIDATINPYTITLTAPIDISGWQLEREVNNERDVGPVYISTTAPTFYQMRLVVTTDYDRLYTKNGNAKEGVDRVMYLSGATPPVPETPGPTGWNMLVLGETTVFEFVHAATPAPITIPIRLRQFITADDPDGDYGIEITYKLSVLAPKEQNTPPPPSPPS